MPGEFVDTNVLLYLTSAERPERAAIVEQLLRGQPVVSVQVLNEFVAVARRKLKRDWSEIRAILSGLTPLLDVHPVSEDMHRGALRIAERYRLQWYDSLLVAAALSLSCKTFLSEDMHASLLIEGKLTVVNPFAQATR